MPKKPATGPVTRVELRRVRLELARLRHIVDANASALANVQKDCETNLRRCAELQRDLDSLRKLLNGGSTS